MGSKLPKMPSHYCHQRSNQLYLEGPFDTKQEVYNLYFQHCVQHYAKENLRPQSKSYLFEFLEEKFFLFFILERTSVTHVQCTLYKMKQTSEEEYENHKNMKERAQEEKK